jgi:cation diffusion facilitator CzcD-associated flavoprotein CzcO
MNAIIAKPDYEAVVIGAGPGGICAGVRLKQAGIDFVILERDSGVGGSWRDNHYPDIGVDVPGLLYQYSFAPNRRWSRLFPKGAEVLSYHQDVARQYELPPHIRYGMQVVREVWNETSACWELTTATGTVITARFVLSAVGAFLVPKDDPGIEGWQDFRGKVLRPTYWDDDYDVRGKRVAIIGTGASSVQITPELGAVAGRVDVYQRTPVWCLPKPDLRFGKLSQKLLALPGVIGAVNWFAILMIDTVLRAVCYTPRFLFLLLARMFDGGARLLYRGYLRMVVRDARVRAALLPDYGPLGKRPTISKRFLQAFNRPNVSLITTPIERITATGVRTRDGVEREVDALVLATGYHLFSDPESYAVGAIVGRDGFDLGQFYNSQGLQAYESVSVHALPNRWTVVGPYSWTGTGWHALVEISTQHIVNVILEARRRGARWVQIREAAHRAYHETIRKLGANLRSYFTEVNKGLRTYYLNSQGDFAYVRPTTLLSAIRNSRHVKFEDYEFGETSEP